MLKDYTRGRSICLWPKKPLCMQSTNRLGPPISFMKCGRKPSCHAGQVSVCVLKCLAFKASVFSRKQTWISYSIGQIEICTFARYQLLTNWLGSRFCKEGIDFGFNCELLEWLPAVVVTSVPVKSYHCSNWGQCFPFGSFVLKGAFLDHIQWWNLNTKQHRYDKIVHIFLFLIWPNIHW